MYQRELAVEKAVAQQEQENVQQGASLTQLQEEVGALTKLYHPIRGRAGEPDCLPAVISCLRQCGLAVASKTSVMNAADQKKRLDAAMRQSHAIHVLREISHQQQSDIQLLQQEIRRLKERSKASFANKHPAQPDIIHTS